MALWASISMLAVEWDMHKNTKSDSQHWTVITSVVSVKQKLNALILPHSTHKWQQVCSGCELIHSESKFIPSVFNRRHSVFTLKLPLFLYCADKSLIVWRLTRDESSYGVPQKSLHGHGHFVSDVILSSDGQFALSGSWDHTLRLWDLSRYRIIASLVSCWDHRYPC